MILKTFKSDNLDIKVFDTRNDMGKAAAADVAACIKETLGRKKEIRMVFAAAPSQNEFLEALAATEGIEWGRVHALHMDEYVNLPADAPQGFGNFLRRQSSTRFHSRALTTSELTKTRKRHAEDIRRF